MFNTSLPTSPRRVLRALLLLSSLAALTAVSVACGPTRSSGDDDPCESDDDCREGEFCRFRDAEDDEGECRSLNTGNPNNENNSTNNSTNNNPTIQYCSDICSRYLQCNFITSGEFDDCKIGCEFSDDVDASRWSCTQSSSCEDIPSCEDNSVNNTTPPSGGPYRFVMIEDESGDNLNGPAPGADIDAIGVDVDGDQVIDHWASVFEDYNLSGDNNEHLDAAELLGEPDSDCEAQNFLSLGGNAGDNYVIVGFGNGADVTFGSGAIIQVWELGPTNCPNQTTWQDDETTISVSLSNDRSTFEVLGTVGVGTNAVIIP